MRLTGKLNPSRTMLTPKQLASVSHIVGEKLSYQTYLQEFLAGKGFSLGENCPGKFLRMSPNGRVSARLPKDEEGRPFALRLQKREICKALGAMATAKIPIAENTKELLILLLRAQDFKEAFLEGTKMK